MLLCRVPLRACDGGELPWILAIHYLRNTARASEGSCSRPDWNTRGCFSWRKDGLGRPDWLSWNVKKYHVKEGLVSFIIALKLYSPNFQSCSCVSVNYFQHPSKKMHTCFWIIRILVMDDDKLTRFLFWEEPMSAFAGRQHIGSLGGLIGPERQLALISVPCDGPLQSGPQVLSWKPCLLSSACGLTLQLHHLGSPEHMSSQDLKALPWSTVTLRKNFLMLRAIQQWNMLPS